MDDMNASSSDRRLVGPVTRNELFRAWTRKVITNIISSNLLGRGRRLLYGIS